MRARACEMRFSNRSGRKRSGSIASAFSSVSRYSRRAWRATADERAGVRALARHHRIDLPIATAVDRVLHEGLPVRDAVLGLLAREPKSES